MSVEETTIKELKDIWTLYDDVDFTLDDHLLRITKIVIIPKIEMIQSLLFKYKQELESNPLDQDIPNFNKTFNGARRLLLLDIIQDLEGLLK